MGVKIGLNSVLRSAAPVCLLLALPLFPSVAARAQSNPTSATNPYFGSVTAQPISDQTLQLSLDDAISRGLKNNLGLIESENSEKTLHGQRNEALQQFLPTITLNGNTGYYQHNLVAQGFKPGLVAKFAKLLPPSKTPVKFSEITRDDLTQGQISYKQTLFSGPVFCTYRASGAAVQSAHFAKMTARGEVIQQVATAYLRCIAEASEVDNAKALTPSRRSSTTTSTKPHMAGTSPISKSCARAAIAGSAAGFIDAQTGLIKTSSCSSGKPASTPARRSPSLILHPTATWPSKPPRNCAHSPTRAVRITQNLQYQVAEFKSSTTRIAASVANSAPLTAPIPLAR